MKSTTLMSIPEIVARERRRLTTFLEVGPDPVYVNAHDYFIDFFVDFSWNAVSLDEFNALLNDPVWVDLAIKVQQKYPDYKFHEEVRLQYQGE